MPEVATQGITDTETSFILTPPVVPEYYQSGTGARPKNLPSKANDKSSSLRRPPKQPVKSTSQLSSEAHIFKLHEVSPEHITLPVEGLTKFFPPNKHSCPCQSDKYNEWIECTKCKHWWHIHCAGVSYSEYAFVTTRHFPYKCPVCVVTDVHTLAVHKLISHIANYIAPIGEVESSETYVKQLTSESSEIHVDQLSTLQTQSHAIVDIVHQSDYQVDINQEKYDAIPQTNIYDDTLIAILDGVTDKTKVANSRTITKEINKTKPELNFSFAYTLPAGGIAIHCKTQADLNIALKDWPNDSFGENVISHLPNKSAYTSTVICRNVSTEIVDDEILKYISQTHSSTAIIHRFKNRQLDTPLPVVKINMIKVNNQTTANKLITNGITIGTKALPCEPVQRIKVIRCFNCQSYGHIGRHCKNQTRCVKCGDNHAPVQCCDNITHCCNCSSNNHSANSNTCPIYQSRLKQLVSRIITTNQKQNEHIAI